MIDFEKYDKVRDEFVDKMISLKFESEDEFMSIWTYNDDERSIEIVMMDEDEFYVRYEYSDRIKMNVERFITTYEDLNDFLNAEM